MPSKCGCGTVFMPIARMKMGDDGVPEFYLYGVHACQHCDVPCEHAVDTAPLVGDADDFPAWERSMVRSSKCELCLATRKTVRLIHRQD